MTKPSLVLIAFLLLALRPAYAELQVFASFEDLAEIAAVKASPGVQFAASNRFPAWGGKSLEVNIPASGGSLEFTQPPADWSKQEALLLFVWSAQPAEIKLSLRDNTGTHFLQTFALRTGVNHLQVRLARVPGVDWRSVQALRLETAHGGRFYFDYFALDRFHPVLAERGRWDIDYSLAVETPHVRWARPFAGTRIKAWALAEVMDGRGVVELAERLEMDLRATSIGRDEGLNKWGFGDFYEHRSLGSEFWADAYALAHTYIADDLLNGPAYDVILWPGIHPWESYPQQVRDEIRRRVEGGAGLILFAPLSKLMDGGGLWDLSPLRPSASNTAPERSAWTRNTEHYITHGVPLDALPTERMRVPRFEATGEVLLTTAQGAPVLAVRKVGRGRVVAFGYDQRGMLPDIEGVFETGLHYPYHEYLWSLVARAVVWASQREPQATLQAIARTNDGLTVTLANTPSDAILQATIRSDFNEIIEEVTIPANSPRLTLPFTKPLPGGKHFAELRLRQGKRIHDWATFAFTTAPPITIRDVRLNTDRVQVGEAVTARIQLNAPATATLTARLYDNYDRLIDEHRSTTNEAETTVRLNTIGVLTHLAHVEVEVSIAGLRADRRIVEVFVLQPRVWDDFDIVMYLFAPPPLPGLWPTIDAQLRELHVSTLSSAKLDHSKHANYNIQAKARVSGQESPDGALRNYYLAMKKKYAETHDKRVLVREYCLNDPAYRERLREELKKLTAPWLPFSPLSYYVLEEPSLTCYEDDLDLCFSTHCMTAMRAWLKGEYGTLAALNQQWSTSFTNWDDVLPDDTYEAQARGNYASWADHRTFMEKSYADCFAFLLSELRKLDPQGIILNSGTQVSGAHNGADYSRLNQYTTHLNAYEGGNQLDFHRAFNPNVKISGGAGYGVRGKDVLYNFYSNLFKGSNGGAYVFWQFSTIDPDLTLSQSGKDMREGFRELRGEGIGKLVGLAAPDNNGIAIHYSYPSLHGAWIVDGKIEPEVVYGPSSATMRRFNANRDGWVKALRDAGLQFDFLGYGDVEKGSLITKGYKTFLLPMSVALSDKEIAAIRAFVQQGGTVIADGLPGVMDQHCTFRSHPALADLFGVVPVRANREAMIAMQGEPALQLRGGHSLLQATAPLTLIENKLGSGRAYLLNFFLDRYPEDKAEGRQLPTLARLQRVFAAAGIAPNVKLESLASQHLTDCDSYLFRQGTTQLLGLIPNKEKPGDEKIRAVFPQPGALYDVRAHRYLGTGTTIETEIEPAVPKLFAQVATRITGLTTQAPPAAQRGEEVNINFRVTGINSLRSVAKVVITDAAGRVVSYYGGNQDIVKSVGTVRFRPALNDPTGTWRIAITEVISGEMARAEIQIQ
ncbi:MAG: alpha-amylase family protein [Blastocatellia bacterium]